LLTLNECVEEVESAFIEYRVTKYDPAWRDASGAYIVDEWTSVTDIGRAFGGRPDSHARY